MSQSNRFCDQCGAAIPSAESRFCPSCGAEVAISDGRPEVEQTAQSRTDRPTGTPPIPPERTDEIAQGEHLRNRPPGIPKKWKIIGGFGLAVVVFLLLITLLPSGSTGGPSAECIAAKQKLANMPPGASVPNIYSLAHADYLIAQGDVTIHCDTLEGDWTDSPLPTKEVGDIQETGSNKQFNKFLPVEGVGVRQELMPIGPSGWYAHVPDGQSVEYNTTPPTSGDHWDTPAKCGFYKYGLPDEQIVHNLEHGNIVVSYNLPNPEDVNELRDVINSIAIANQWGITRSYDKIPEGQVALAAWGVLDTLEGIDRKRIEEFYQYAGNLGDEKVNC